MRGYSGGGNADLWHYIPVHARRSRCFPHSLEKVYFEFKRIKIKVKITNQDGKTVSRGNIVTGVLK